VGVIVGGITMVGELLTVIVADERLVEIASSVPSLYIFVPYELPEKLQVPVLMAENVMVAIFAVPVYPVVERI
jgi:hypothetical protein